MILSIHQLFLLKHFAIGWKFKLYGNSPAAWCAYWALRRKNLIAADSVVTDFGRQVLAQELARQSKRKKRYAKGTNQPNPPSARASACSA